MRPLSMSTTASRIALPAPLVCQCCTRVPGRTASSLAAPSQRPSGRLLPEAALASRPLCPLETSAPSPAPLCARRLPQLGEGVAGPSHRRVQRGRIRITDREREYSLILSRPTQYSSVKMSVGSFTLLESPRIRLNQNSKCEMKLSIDENETEDRSSVSTRKLFCARR